MPTLKVYQHGTVAGVAPARNDHPRAKRGKAQGWTDRSTRSNTRFLYSVDESQLTGIGYAVTLTVRDCPPAHTDWKNLRQAFFERLARMYYPMLRNHWLTEWQRRGVPHLHAAIWFDFHPDDASEWVNVGQRGTEKIVPMEFASHHRLLLDHWLEVARDYRPAARSQNITPISDSLGWFQYLAKHAIRGVQHYQRSPENVPPGWEQVGRVWGYRGQWPTQEPLCFGMDERAFYRYRRIVRSMKIAEARQEAEPARISRARRMLGRQPSGPMDLETRRRISRVRGVNEWVSMADSLRVIDYLRAQGHNVNHD